MDDDLPRRKEYALSPSRMSKTPSWIMLGFILGALFVAALPPLRKKPVPSAPPRQVELSNPRPRQPQPLSTIEAVFEQWHKFAVWSDDTTEVALWNSEYRDFVDYYEVRRTPTAYYFRSLSALTRRPYRPPNLPPDSPLRFTETDEQFRERMNLDAATELRRPAPSAAPTVAPPASPPVPRLVPGDPNLSK